MRDKDYKGGGDDDDDDDGEGERCGVPPSKMSIRRSGSSWDYEKVIGPRDNPVRFRPETRFVVIVVVLGCSETSFNNFPANSNLFDPSLVNTPREYRVSNYSRLHFNDDTYGSVDLGEACLKIIPREMFPGSR